MLWDFGASLSGILRSTAYKLVPVLYVCELSNIAQAFCPFYVVAPYSQFPQYSEVTTFKLGIQISRFAIEWRPLDLTSTTLTTNFVRPNSNLVDVLFTTRIAGL